LMFKVSG